MAAESTVHADRWTIDRKRSPRRAFGLTTLDIIFICLFLVSMTLGSVMPPPLANYDVYGFKDAGCNYAYGQGFVSAAWHGTPDYTPRFFSNYAPLFQMLFGFYASWFGYSIEANHIFNLIISGVSAIIGYCLLRQLLLEWQNTLAAEIFAGLIGALGGIGILGQDSDRPETLGAAIGLISIAITSASTTNLGVAIAAFVLGVCFLTAPFIGMVCGLLILLTLFERGDLYELPRLSAAAAGFAIPLLITAVWFQIKDPHWAMYFLEHLHASKTLAAQKLSYLQRLRYVALMSRSTSLLIIAKWLALLAIVVFAVSTHRIGSLSALAMFVILLAPANPNYTIEIHYYGPAAILVGFLLVTRLDGGRIHTPSVLTVATLTAMFVPSLIYYGRSLIIQGAYADSLANTQLAAPQAMRVAKIREGWLLVPSRQYFLFKDLYNRISDPDKLPTRVPAGSIRGEVACYTTSGDRNTLPSFQVLKGDGRLIPVGSPQTGGWLAEHIGHSYLGWECVMKVVDDSSLKTPDYRADLELFPLDGRGSRH
jgi:hypothetical protein